MHWPVELSELGSGSVGHYVGPALTDIHHVSALLTLQNGVVEHLLTLQSGVVKNSPSFRAGR